MIRITRHFLHVTYYIGLALMASIAVAWGWLAMGERQLRDFPEFIQHLILPEDSGYMVDADSVGLKVAGVSSILEIHMKQARFLQNGEKVFMSFPEVIAALDLKYLAIGRVVMDYVLLKQPELWIERDMSGQISFKSGEGDSDEEAYKMLGAWLEGDAAGFSLPQIKRLFLREASLTLKDERTGSLWQAPKADIELERDKNGQVHASLMTELTSKIGDKTMPSSQLDVTMLYDMDSKRLEGELKLNDISPKMIAGLNPALTPLEGFDIKLDAHAFFMRDMEKGGDELKILFTGEKGKISLPDYIPGEHEIKKFSAMVKLSDAASNIELSNLDVETPDMTISASLNLQKQDTAWQGKADVGVSGMEVNSLKNYWKEDLFPVGRKWVMDHIKGGVVTDASAKADFVFGGEDGFKPGDYEATVAVKGARVSYYEDLTAVDDVVGVLTLKPNLLAIDMQEGHIGDMHLKHGTLSLPDMTAYETWLDIDLEVAGNAVDAVKYLQNPMFAVFMKPVNITPDNSSGDSEGKIHLHIPIGGPEKDPRQFGYDISASVKNAASAAVFGKMQISDANLNLDVNNDELKLKGDMKLFGAPGDIDLVDRYKKPGVQDTDYTLNLTTDRASLEKIGVILPDIFKGPFRMTSKVRMDGKNESATHDLDLTKTEVDLGYFNFTKPPGKNGSLHLETKNVSGSNIIEVNKFELDGDNVKAVGNLKLDIKKGRLEELVMPSAKFGKNDISVKYIRTKNDEADSVEASIKGTALDISKLYGQDQIFGGHEPWPYINSDIDVATLSFGEGRELKNVTGHLKCSPGECSDGALHASYVGGGAVDYKLGSENGVRTVRINTANFGELVRVLDITDNIVGGEMNITAAFEDNKNDRPLAGLMKVGPYNTIHAPVLAKLLNLASFSGVGELLGGKGIAFDKMSMPFVMKDGVINIKDGKSSGSSLGITVGGNIDTNSKQMKLEGTLVPSYGINSLPGAIPVVGDLLVGGKGGGIFGVNYSVTGSYSDPKITVNPLSLLTPGFLRGIFGSGDSEPKPIPAPEEKQDEKPEGDKKP